jgi:hypothetical protein
MTTPLRSIRLSGSETTNSTNNMKKPVPASMPPKPVVSGDGMNRSNQQPESATGERSSYASDEVYFSFLHAPLAD